MRKQEKEDEDKRLSIEEAMREQEHLSNKHDEQAIWEWEAAEEAEFQELVMRTKLEFG